MKLAQCEAYKLFHQGAIELAYIEANGMRVDVERLDRTIKSTAARIEQLTVELKQDDIWETWRRRFGVKASLGSRVQLGKAIHEHTRDKSNQLSGMGKTPSMDAEALSKIDLPFVKKYLELVKLEKLQSTYLKGYKREVQDGFVHPVFNLHFVKTYRSSCDSPNFQNIPIRDPELGRLIRSCFIPREGHTLVEVDYGAIEVRIAACYTHDDRLIQYIEDPNTDMHRDMAVECYQLDPSQVTKESRYCAKNMFVFPEFYGSYYVRCAQNLWEAIDKQGLKTKAGDCLYDHLADGGIKSLGKCNPKYDTLRGTFEHHIKGVEKRFWEKFHGYAEWKEKWLRDYQKNGGFDLLTGFRIDGVYSRNQVLNTPMQGVAFHCLLWSLIKMNRWLRKNKMKTVIVGQIHDSILADVHKDELQDYLHMAKRIMTIDIQKHWPWLIVPLVIDAEASDVSWFNKKEIPV